MKIEEAAIAHLTGQTCDTCRYKIRDDERCSLKKSEFIIPESLNVEETFENMFKPNLARQRTCKKWKPIRDYSETRMLTSKEIKELMDAVNRNY